MSTIEATVDNVFDAIALPCIASADPIVTKVKNGLQRKSIKLYFYFHVEQKN